ncbi:uncharacterized protein LOC124551147 isoform X2 [Schistocerca americana]|uniref:uncharacterized protein LOC124551147 isoform X2 n=1 Tax=Schistocerca americana TaxID=7009 RepID=UPI001F503611|nr:uncharacterized protein LOC124551147 isoform X2 [Schistocerca americana]
MCMIMSQDRKMARVPAGRDREKHQSSSPKLRGSGGAVTLGVAPSISILSPVEHSNSSGNLYRRIGVTVKFHTAKKNGNQPVKVVLLL